MSEPAPKREAEHSCDEPSCREGCAPEMRPQVRFCIHNVTKEDHAMLVDAGAEPHDCFGRCTDCFERAYLVTGDRDPQSITEQDVVEGESDDETHAELLRRVLRSATSDSTKPG